MTINKSSSIWAQAPWYVKVGAFGYNTYRGIAVTAIICALIAAISPVVSLALYWFGFPRLAYVVMSASLAGLSAYLYSLALIWLVKHPEVFE